MSVTVGADAKGAVVLALGGAHDEIALAAIARTLDGAVFPGRSATSDVTGNGGGFPLIEFTSTGVFDPGDSPTVELDTRPLCDDLTASGFTDLVVRLSLPRVAHESAIVPGESSDSTWDVRSCDAAPHGAVVLNPNPHRFWFELLLVLIVVAANVALAVIGSRRLNVPRWMTIGLSGTAVAVFLVAIATAGFSAGDDMEVAGRISHAANLFYFAISAIIVLLGPIAAFAQPFYWRLPRDQRPRLRRRPTGSGAGAGDDVR